MTKLAVLELNELNFELLERYIVRGRLPNFARFFAHHGYCETTSEVRYAELEPWIQWVTAHTGRRFSEHGIFRLGDAVDSGVPQIWEQLESEHGVKAGAISPMNAANRLCDPAFFVPDPWTPTSAAGSWLLQGLSEAVSQAVNDNAQKRITPRSLCFLLLGLARYARVANYGAYLRLVAGVFTRPWNRVRFLDLFLSDIFVSLTRAKRPGFCTLFVNGAAHLQHHYMLSSPLVAAEQNNPAWYLKADADPVGDIYRTYDYILGAVVNALPDYRVMLVTGLHQDPCPSPIFYWRPREHAALLEKLGCVFAGVQPRMSRDFIVSFAKRADLERCVAILEKAQIDGSQAFKVEDRGGEIFVELIYARDIREHDKLVSGEVEIPGFRSHVIFVALKNGVHNGVGYFSDSGRRAEDLPSRMPLTQIHGEILGIFGSPAAAAP